MEEASNRELRITRTFKAPISLVWEVWTNPEHIANWWGPNGFTNTIHDMDLREGGEWKLTMHGPDGTNYPNRSIFKEIIPLKKIVFEHFNPHFITTVIFESEGEKTFMDWCMLFDTADLREIVVKAHKADVGQKQNVDKLEKYLSNLLSEKPV
ncbi:MAG TPA: SRPBCC family protein [Chitinophagaceae bacterium]|nr:SRPBCC family protein [Chitinophagaceae bacterium]